MIAQTRQNTKNWWIWVLFMQLFCKFEINSKIRVKKRKKLRSNKKLQGSQEGIKLTLMKHLLRLYPSGGAQLSVVASHLMSCFGGFNGTCDYPNQSPGGPSELLSWCLLTYSLGKVSPILANSILCFQVGVMLHLFLLQVR